MLTIDDSAYPSPTTTDFADLAVGDTFRQNSKYYIKMSPSSAYSFTDNTTASVSGGCEKVTATLTITAP